ncbi:isoflavone reductase IRL [Echria macrotheca]|uniref:Isoflavone reductase IRL n=1 Tax=Echria macrotheca TaxID=438768 RepID=A0AAJ0B326_9PEZI|nr:isoflavone reductase IRL [Echria macrotheca]
MSAPKKLVVCGGSGFLGSRICRAAVSRGWDVISISRSGQPKWQHLTSSTPPDWSGKVSWEKADMFRPAQYRPLLRDADCVVHTMGILLEADYKGVVSGRESPISGLRKAFSSTSSTPNPLERNYEESPPPTSPQQMTYEMMNRDSALLLAKEASQAGVKTFGYVSAAAGAPVLPSRYITTKREAEALIAREFPGMRSVFFRAPFMYDSSRAFTVPLAAMTAAGALFNGVTGGILGGFLGAAVVKPLKADVVADAVVEALDDEKVSGPVEVAELEELAGRGWRKGML